MSILKWLDKNFEYVCLAMILFVMTVLSFTNVVMRYCFHNALSWSDELCCYGLALSAFFALPASIRHQSQIRVDTLTMLLSEKTQKYVGMVCNVVMLIFTSICTKGSFDLYVKTLSTNQKSPALQIPVANLYAVMGFCFLLAVLRVVQALVTGFKKTNEEKKA